MSSHVQNMNKPSKVKPRSRLGCNGCKKLKTKCDEIKPTCSRCAKRNIKCIYSFEMLLQNPKLMREKKKLKIKDLELLQSDEKRLRRLALLKSTQDLNKKICENDVPNNSVIVSGHLLHDIDPNKNISVSGELLHKKKLDSLPYNIESFIPLSKIAILPLPDNLLDHPYYKSAFDFYKHFTAYFIVAARPQIYKMNPMHELVPKYAEENNCLLDLLIAFSLTHRSLVLNDENYSSNLVELLISRGLLRLASSLNETSSNLKSEVICITALMMCTQKIFSGKDIDKYKETIDLARNSFESFVQENKTIQILPNGKYSISENDNPFEYFLLSWIAYLEIIGVMMAISPKTYRIPYRPEFVFSKYEMRKKSKIDLFLGFDIQFLIIFDKLIPIITSFEDLEQSGVNENITTEILSKGIEWEHELNKAYEAFENSHKNLEDPTETDIVLNATNQAFYNAGLLHLYRRVYKLPRSNPEVQKLVSKIYKCFKNDIESASSAENCSIFSLFIAACESINEEHRAFFYDRFNIQFLGGNFPAGDVLKILENTWESGDSWVESVKKVTKSSGFFLI